MRFHPSPKGAIAYRFSDNGLPLPMYHITGRRINIMTRMIGPREDPYEVRIYRVETRWRSDLLKQEMRTVYEFEVDSLAMMIRFRRNNVVLVEGSMVDEFQAKRVEEWFANLTGIHPSRFEKLYYSRVYFPDPIKGWM